jgi:hypothetical protein
MGKIATAIRIGVKKGDFGYKRQDEKLEPAIPFCPHGFKTEIIIGYNPVIFITPDVLSDMFILVDESPIEIGWMGMIKKLPRGNFLIEKIILPEQTCSSIETSLDPDSIGKLANSLLRQKNGTEEYAKLRFWGHSHVEMDIDPSPADNDQIEQFRKNGCDYFIRGILNRKGQMQFSVFYFNLGVAIMDAPWAIHAPMDLRKRSHWRKQIALNCKEEVYSRVSSAMDENHAHGHRRTEWEKEGEAEEIQRWNREHSHAHTKD